MASFLVAIIPTLGVSFLFWLAVRAMLQADRRERAEQARRLDPGDSGGQSEGSIRGDGPDSSS